MQGYDVLFLTGTDEHGLKIEQKAAEKGVTPKAYVDEIVAVFKKLWSYMNISYDRYIRTTDDYHIETVQKIFKELYDRGYIYKGEYKRPLLQALRELLDRQPAGGRQVPGVRPRGHRGR